MLRALLVVALTAAAAAVPAASAPSALIHFKSPSGNINCLGSTSGPPFVDCLVKSSTWPYRPPRPARCDLDWAPTEIEMASRKVSVGGCRGDIGPLCGPSSGLPCTTLAFGQSVNIGPIRCSSASDGITCAYRAAPRTGFRIAREGFAVFHS